MLATSLFPPEVGRAPRGQPGHRPFPLPDRIERKLRPLMATRPDISPGVRRIILDLAGLPLSGLLAEPENKPVRAAVVALHGVGMNAGYFDAQSSPDLSLLRLGPSLGYTVLSLDRPGYGRSAKQLPQGQRLVDQIAAVGQALEAFSSRFAIGTGVLLLAHSFGGKVAIGAAASDATGILAGLDLSGIGHRQEMARCGGAAEQRGGWECNWGPLRLYPSSTFCPAGAPVEPTPPLDIVDASRWPAHFDELAPDVRVPVRLTFAEHESWWRHDPDTVAELIAVFRAAPRVAVEHLRDAGHNISLGWAARSYHLRALAFLEECLTLRKLT
ncbi:alpha/beta fold hydrolase [Solwaraspora sp. WMMD406]|uniref:alpha/beta hydrolase n=1 Tax=Solwaraspora sp. WMMD406 TaxID=3016095 RepID=UPI0024166DBF|nr:alpha/beta fold hydrolase [Solwaraspora sp. WMMD406]MDG4763535.1 alpha/beta fold hydrolase [Solwaraspora sp. WMMD406]